MKVKLTTKFYLDYNIPLSLKEFCDEGEIDEDEIKFDDDNTYDVTFEFDGGEINFWGVPEKYIKKLYHENKNFKVGLETTTQLEKSSKSYS